MRSACGYCLALLGLAVVPLVAAGQPVQPVANIAAPAGTTVRDDWDIAYLDGHRIGYVRLKVEELTHSSGTKIYRASREMSLTVRRGPDFARVRQTSTSGCSGSTSLRPSAACRWASSPRR